MEAFETNGTESEETGTEDADPDQSEPTELSLKK